MRLATAAAPGRARRVVLPLAAAVVVLYGALLRADAVIERYGKVTGSPAVEALQDRVVDVARAIRPRGLAWSFSGAHHGDPSSYLKIARARTSFYQADLREPLYVGSVRALLGLTGDQDVAVSWTSAIYSSALVLATDLLGATAFGPPIGLVAAALLATEATVIRIGVDGWRDDAFACFVVLCAWAMLRLTRRPSAGAGAVLGVVAAGAMLTRISSFTFLLPGLAALLLVGPRQRWRERLRAVAVATLVGLLLVAPYLVNCARVFGDPLIAINFATERFDTAGPAPDEDPSWTGMLARKIGHRPLTMVDTVFHGVTTYPFTNKWEGLRHLSPALALTVEAAALVGLCLLAGFAEGRLLLLVLLGALVPFAFTWRIPGGGEWRFTLFAYPFYLLAAAFALGAVPRGLARGLRDVPERLRAVDRRTWAAAAASLACLAVSAHEIPKYWRFALVREAARADGGYSIVAGPGDGLFFREGWYPPVRTGMVTGRYSHGAKAALRVPIFEREDVVLSFRMQACSDTPEPRRDVRVTINGAEHATLPVVWDPQRARSYDVTVPGASLRPGWNRVELAADGASVMPAGESRYLALDPGSESAFFLWYVRVEPARRADQGRG